MMDIQVKPDRLSVELAAELATAEVAVTNAIDRTANRVKIAWRNSVRQALGPRLANSIRSATYPQRGASLNAAALVYATPGKAEKGGAAAIILGHEEGAVIRSRNGFWLTIPTEEAGKGKRGARMTPLEWERRHGVRLQFVYRSRGPSLLVAPVKLTKSGRLGKARMTKKGLFGKGTMTSVIFLLVPQARLRKKLNLIGVADRLVNDLPEAIAREWRKK